MKVSSISLMTGRSELMRLVTNIIISGQIFNLMMVVSQADIRKFPIYHDMVTNFLYFIGFAFWLQCHLMLISDVALDVGHTKPSEGAGS